MRRIGAFFCLMVCSAAADCAPVILDVDSLMDLNGIGLRAGITGPEARAFLLYTGSPLRNGSLRLGFASPWVIAGPLVPRGLFREIDNPLGFKAGSDVFSERTNMVLDGSLDAGGLQGLLLAPVPGVSVFCACREPDGIGAGGFASLPLSQGLILEGLAEYTHPPESTMQEEWFPGAFPFPGGGIVHAAGRILWQAPPFSLTVSLCASGCRIALPGSLMNFDFSVGGKDLSAEAFWGAAQREYLAAGGDGGQDRLGFGVIVRAARPEGAAVLHYSISLDQEEFSWNRFAASREKAGFSIEKTPWGEGSNGLRMILDAEDEVNYDGRGRRGVSAEGTLGIAWTMMGEESRLGLTVAEAGPKVSFSIGLSLADIHLGLEGNAVLTPNGMTVTALCGLRLAEKAGTLAFKVGIQDIPVTDAIKGRSSFRMNVGWTAHSEAGPP